MHIRLIKKNYKCINCKDFAMTLTKFNSKNKQLLGTHTSKYMTNNSLAHMTSGPQDLETQFQILVKILVSHRMIVCHMTIEICN